MTDRCRTVPWAEVTSFYQDLVQEHGPPLQPMLALVDFLASSRYGRSLFACPSQDLLRLGRAPDFLPGSDELQVRFDGQLQRFTFTHVQRPDEPNPWSRECEATEWRQGLERLFHKRLQWFHEG
jgi:hypothetical protein